MEGRRDRRLVIGGAVVTALVIAVLVVGSRHVGFISDLLFGPAQPQVVMARPMMGFAADPCGLVTVAEVEHATRSRTERVPRREGPRQLPGGPYLTCSFDLEDGDLVTVNVVKGLFTRDGFDAYSSVMEAKQPGSALPVAGLGERATFNPHHSAMRVLSRGTIVTVTTGDVTDARRVTGSLLHAALRRLPAREPAGSA